MKKFTSTYILIVLGMLSATSFAQVAKKYVIFEHFTQASCGPCASQNPAFQDNILKKNEGLIHHMAVHTSWPGTDPMYTHNSSQSTEMVNYYGITGVPTMIMLGNKFSGSPATVSQDMVDSEVLSGSPIQILVSDVDNAGTRDVKVTVKTVGTVPAGNYVLKIAVVEKEIVYPSAPGSNGEKEFPNVFRKMLTSTSGNTVTIPSNGSSADFNYTYTYDAAWNSANIYVLAWVQNSDTKEILNSGSTLDPANGLVPYVDGAVAGMGSPGTPSTFGLKLSAVGNSETYRVVLKKDAPSNWAADYRHGTANYTDTSMISLSNGTFEQLYLDVTPGADVAVGTYTFEITSMDDPNLPSINVKYSVLSGVTDLVIDNDGGKTWETMYVSGLVAANNTKYGVGNLALFNNLASQLSGSSVKNIYWNAGWTFPSLTDQIVSGLAAFLDGGGNLLMAGQDIGWETYDANSTTWTTNTRSFYTNYLKAQYVNDGGTSNNKFIANTADPVYGAITTSNVVDKYAGNMYPDQITPLAGAVATFYYNTAKTKTGALRYQNSTTGSKVAYFGIGLEMVQTAAVRDEIMKQTHDWFYGLVGIDNQPVDIHISISPNPVQDKLTLSFNLSAKQDVSYTITNVLGEVILSGELGATEKGNVSLDLSGNAAGVYFANVNTAKGTSVKKFVLGN